MTIARMVESGRRRVPVVLPLALLVAFQGCQLVSYVLELTSVTLGPSNPSVASTTTQQFTAHGTYGDETERDVTAEAAWTSSNPAVATVSSTGLATPVQPGTTTITASLQGVSGSTTLTVTSAQLLSLEVTPPSASIPNGTQLQLAASGHFDDGSTQDLTSQVTWTSSEPSVTVGDGAGSKGLATSLALGAASATVTAAFDGISGSTTLTVVAVSLTAVEVTPATATIKVGASRQFAATGRFSDGSTHEMTREVTWSSSDPSVAAVDGTGRATGLFASPSSVSIAATSSALLGSVSGAAQLTVEAASPGY